MLLRRRVPGGGVMARDAARDRAEKGMVSRVMAGDATHYGALDAALGFSPARRQGKTETSRCDCDECDTFHGYPHLISCHNPAGGARFRTAH